MQRAQASQQTAEQRLANIRQQMVEREAEENAPRRFVQNRKGSSAVLKSVKMEWVLVCGCYATGTFHFGTKQEPFKSFECPSHGMQLIGHAIGEKVRHA